MSKDYSPKPVPGSGNKFGVINEGKGLPQSTLKVPMPTVQPPKPSSPSSPPKTK